MSRSVDCIAASVSKISVARFLSPGTAILHSSSPGGGRRGDRRAHPVQTAHKSLNSIDGRVTECFRHRRASRTVRDYGRFT
jgi:hypothetical protein